MQSRLWSPGDSPVEEDVAKATQENQQRMQEGPQMLRGINPRVMQVCWLMVRPAVAQLCRFAQGPAAAEPLERLRSCQRLCCCFENRWS